MINETMLKMWLLQCDHCEGSGGVYDPEIYTLIRRERIKQNILAKDIAIVARIPYTRYCKFENGRTMLSQQRITKIIEIINDWENTHESLPTVESAISISPA